MTMLRSCDAFLHLTPPSHDAFVLGLVLLSVKKLICLYLPIRRVAKTAAPEEVQTRERMNNVVYTRISFASWSHEDFGDAAESRSLISN